ncbi:MAG: hypothetical protein NC081_07075 [Roseburia sp.]|nr:hypothetical protein [Roseburia sp.]
MAPIIKNSMPRDSWERGKTPITKNITVTDEKGTIIGATYPKRARGLVKNGRALYVDDCTIRLSAKAVPSDDKSEVNQMKYIMFNPRNWSICEANQRPFFSQNSFFNGSPQTPAERSFMTDFDGGLVECFMLGGWTISYVEIVSKHYALIPDEEYCFVFWLNGGENDRNDEVCQLRIVFSGDVSYGNTYKLNRSYIKPLLHYQGWELYAITFQTPKAEADTDASIDTMFSFIAGNAPMTVKTAKEPKAYEAWEDTPDEFARQRPQRHNIVFEDGWPSINMYGGDKYSTEILRKRQSAEEEPLQELKNFWEELNRRHAELLRQYHQQEKVYRESGQGDVSGGEERGSIETDFAGIGEILSECQGKLRNLFRQVSESHRMADEDAWEERKDELEDDMNDIESEMDEVESMLEDIVERLQD